MTDAEREHFYDAEIAPVLLALARRCREQGLSFVACVGWGGMDTGATVSMEEIAAPTLRMVRYAALCRNNVDVLINALVQDGARLGHSSIFLERLGVPPVVPGGEQ